MSLPEPAERRAHPRVAVPELAVMLRAKGRLARHPGVVKDFNRHGCAVVVDQQIAKDVHVFIDLAIDEVRLENVVGVVHNCIVVDDGYRLGIQFRTKSDLQFDQSDVERLLKKMERAFAKA